MSSWGKYLQNTLFCDFFKKKKTKKNKRRRRSNFYEAFASLRDIFELVIYMYFCRFFSPVEYISFLVWEE